MDKKILIVDDELDIVEMLELRLSSKGYRIIKAYDGEEALKKAEDEHPDLILLDVMIPSPDGFEVCRVIKGDEKLKDIPVFLVTAKVTEEDRQKGYAIGADDYIAKPYDAHKLMDKIKMCIG